MGRLELSYLVHRLHCALGGFRIHRGNFRCRVTDCGHQLTQLETYVTRTMFPSSFIAPETIFSVILLQFLRGSRINQARMSINGAAVTLSRLHETIRCDQDALSSALQVPS